MEMSRVNPARGLGVICLSLLLGSCGYALVGLSSSLPEDIESIYVQPLVNGTTRSQVDQFLTRAIVDELVTRQRFRVANNRTDADAVLSGTVIGFRARPVTFASGGRATDYEVEIRANMEFTRADGSDEIIWRQPNYNFRGAYEIDVSASDYFDREDLAIAEVAVRFAETLMIDILEGF